MPIEYPALDPAPLIPTELLPRTTKGDRANYRLAPPYVHKMALLAWLNRHFQVAEGYPVPVVFATPQDAFSQFSTLWKGASNPFAYLYKLVDAKGTPLYEPYPSNVRYPLISVKEGKLVPVAERSWSKNWDRHLYWPTIDKKPVLGELGNVAQQQMASGWDFNYQIDFWSRNADTQQVFMADIMDAFSLVTGMGPSCRVRVAYPGEFGVAQHACWMYMLGDIEPIVEDQLDTKPIDFRVSISVKMAGWRPSIDVTLQPALWFMDVVTPEGQDTLNYLYPEVYSDLRTGPNTGITLSSRADVPPLSRRHWIKPRGLVEYTSFGEPTITVL